MNTHDHDFASRIVGTIEERDLSPKPRWEFILRNILILFLGLLSVILGAFTVATSEFLLVDRDWDLYRKLSSRNTIATVESLPYLWIAALLLLLVVTYNLLTRTRRGYRFAPITVLGVSVLTSLAAGSALYAVGIGPQTHEYFRENVPLYNDVVISRDSFWMNPQQGLLAGIVVHATSSSDFLLRDVRGGYWYVTVSGDSDGVALGAHVRAIGSVFGPQIFVAESVLPWTPGTTIVVTTTSERKSGGGL